MLVSLKTLLLWNVTLCHSCRRKDKLTGVEGKSVRAPWINADFAIVLTDKGNTMVILNQWHSITPQKNCSPQIATLLNFSVY